MNTTITKIGQKYDKLINSRLLDFDEVALKRNVMGVYIIYETLSSEIIYIGNTNKFHVRFGTDLKHETTHTLVKKLIKTGKFKDRIEVKNYLQKKCKVRIEECQFKREAEALEHIAIFILNPKYNSWPITPLNE